MMATLRKVSDMAHASSGDGWKVPDWFLRGVIAVVFAAIFIGVGAAAVQDHTKVWEHEAAIVQQKQDIGELKERAKTWDQTPTDIAVMKQDIANVKEQNKEIIRLLREDKRGGTNDR